MADIAKNLVQMLKQRKYRTQHEIVQELGDEQMWPALSAKHMGYTQAGSAKSGPSRGKFSRSKLLEKSTLVNLDTISTCKNNVTEN